MFAVYALFCMNINLSVINSVFRIKEYVIRQRRQCYLEQRVKKAWPVLDFFNVLFLLKLNRTVVLTQITWCLAAEPQIRPPNVWLDDRFLA